MNLGNPDPSVNTTLHVIRGQEDDMDLGLELELNKVETICQTAQIEISIKSRQRLPFFEP
uniref:Uncharacterized protein n=1 Tax=Cucumis melo TaxID=3656 RepID=A0A9I9E8R4_CUCME